MTFYLEKATLYISISDGLELNKNVLMSLFLKNTSFQIKRQYLMDWSGVGYYDVFIIFLDSHSDGTHSLQSIHWWASDVMQHFSKSVLMEKQGNVILGGLGSIQLSYFGTVGMPTD